MDQPIDQPMNKLFTRLLALRRLDNNFLYPRYEDLTDPFVLPDLDQAIQRLERAIKLQENILIYGDYDVDGVTASTLMEQALRLAGVDPDRLQIMLPDRFRDGYGMSERLVDRAKDAHTTLVLTVDCGSRNHDIIDQLSRTNIDTIVTDHHECGDTLPPALAVINPHRHDYTGPATLTHLAGVGVAFKFAEALARRGLIQSGQEKWLLDLVLLGTICDQMELTGENRILGYYGLKVLEKTRRPGLRELIRSAGIKSLTSEAIGYQIGPRLNAAGRLETAELALRLLRATSATKAAALAAKLESLNNQRRKEQRAASAEIAARYSLATRSAGPTASQPGNDTDFPPVLIETGSWHEGILGIVAGHLVEDYHRPAFVLTELADGTLKGSGRSFGDFNLAAALNYASSAHLGGGGHAAAAGVRLGKDQLTTFKAKIIEYYENLHLTDQERYLKVSADLATTTLREFSLDLLDNLSLLEPFGPGNAEPIFRLTTPEIVETKHMGDHGQHLRLDLRGTDGGILKCVAFSAPDAWHHLDDYTRYDFLVRPVANEFRGTRSCEARLLDIIPAQ